MLDKNDLRRLTRSLTEVSQVNEHVKIQYMLYLSPSHTLSYLHVVCVFSAADITTASQYEQLDSNSLQNFGNDVTVCVQM